LVRRSRTALSIPTPIGIGSKLKKSTFTYLVAKSVLKNLDQRLSSQYTLCFVNALFIV
jgi:hypothetical protein